MIKIKSDHPDAKSWDKNANFINFSNTDGDTMLYTWNPKEVLNDNSNLDKNVLIIEPYSLEKEVIDFVYNNADKFNHIFTHDDRLLTLPNAHIFYWGGIWESDIRIPKTKNLSIICSNKNRCHLHEERLKIAKYIEENQLGDTFGTYNGGEMVNTITAHSPYKFAIVVENYIEDYWFTEKICNCFANKTIPIYIGAKKIGKLFNKDGIIEVNNLEDIKKLLKDFDFDKEYKKREKAIEDNYGKVFKYQNTWDLLYQMYGKYFIKENNNKDSYTIKAKNIYYFYHINTIGGIETFYYYLAKKYQNKDFIIVYKEGDKKQIERLSKYFNCIKFDDNQIFECEKAFFNFNTDIIDKVKAEEYILVLHGDYKAMLEQGIISKNKLPMHPKINKYVGVSKIACTSFEELTGKKCELCYNPVVIDKPKRVLRLISATRLTVEKGKGRMIKLIELLNANNIPYEWIIFTNDTKVINDEHIRYMKPTLDIINYIADADYLVQLSDNEGYCYSVVEALCCGVPVICTPCPVFEEIGLVDKQNCFYCDFEMKNVPIKEIYESRLNFEYTPKEDRWEELLAPGKSQYQENIKYKYLVAATNKFVSTDCRDIELNRIPKPNETWWVDYNRYQKLTDAGYATLKCKKKKEA